MSTYDYILQGVPLTDNRWGAGPEGGVWHLLPETSVLPHFPGLQVTRYTRPRQHGESQTQFAPLAPRVLELNIRFFAICSDPGHPLYQHWGRTFDERMAFLEHNINDFLFRSRIGATSSGGYLELRRVNNQFEHFPAGTSGVTNRTQGTQITAGRFISSSESRMDQDAHYADYTLLFEVPDGTWWTEEVEVVAEIPDTSTHEVLLPMGTAPVWDSLIAIRQSGDRLAAGSRITSDIGTGFELTKYTDSWWIYDTLDVHAARAGAGANPNWNNTSNTDDSLIGPLGPLEGSALMINPTVPGEWTRQGLVKVRLTAPGTVIFRYNPRFF